jgi:adenine-specific DNA-methyltransferase
VIKYIGSKRTLVPLLSGLAAASEAKTALDLFTGTTRVAKAFKELGLEVTAVDLASYSEVFSKTWIALDSRSANLAELEQAMAQLNSLPGKAGYFTKTFCEDARYFQPKNGERVDSMRDALERDYLGSWMYEPLLTALILAADRVDSTTGIQMAFLKSWAPRSNNQLSLRDPGLLAGAGTAIRGDAIALASQLQQVDLAYLDPPYNQHRYFSNYHIWETLVRWDNPETYGIANKRIDVRGDDNRSAFNTKKLMPAALSQLIKDVRADTMILSYNSDSWLVKDELIDICSQRGHVEVIDVDFKRYVGAQIGVYNKSGEKVGSPGAKRNLEHVVIAGDKAKVKRMVNSIV